MVKGRNLFVSIKQGLYFRNKKGSIAVETAFFLPIILLALLTLGSVIKANSISEKFMYIMSDEAELLSIQSYTNVGKLRALTFSDRVEKRLKENGENCEDIKVKNFFYIHPEIYNISIFGKEKIKTIDNIISFSVNYNFSNGLFPIFDTDKNKTEKIKFRAFVGTDDYSTEGFEFMEKNDEYIPVWIFPKSGRCYHKKSCTYISSNPVRTVMTSNLKRNHKACKVCKPKKIKNGDVVYCFFRGGKAYHLGNCEVLDKYSIEIDKSDAEDKGYRPCLRCGGC